MRKALIAIIFGCLVFSFGCKKEQPQQPESSPAAPQSLPQKEKFKQQVQENITKENMGQELEKIEKEIRQDISNNE